LRAKVIGCGRKVGDELLKIEGSGRGATLGDAGFVVFGPEVRIGAMEERRHDRKVSFVRE